MTANRRGGRITPGRMVYLVLKRNLRLKSLRLSHAVARARVSASSRLANPQLRVTRLSQTIAQGDVGGTTVRLRWQPPRPSNNTARRDRAAALARAQAQSIRRTTYLLIARARGVYARLQVLGRRIPLSSGRAAVKKKLWGFTRKQAAAGLCSYLKAELARLAYLDRLNRLGDLRRRRDEQQRRLALVLGLDGSQPVVPGPSLFAKEVPATGLQELIVGARRRSPELAAIRAKYRASGAALWMARARRYPWLSFVQATWDAGEPYLPNRFMLGFGLTLPVADWTSGRVGLERRKLASLKGQARVLRARIAARVGGRYRVLNQAQAELVRFRRSIMAPMEKSLARVQEARRKKGVDLAQILKAEEYAIRLKLSHLDRILAYQLARIDLELASYRPVWRDHGIRFGS